MKAVRLRVEYLKNPIGIDIRMPRFSWNCKDGVTQSAYRIIAEDENGRNLWDSGKILSAQMVHIRWNGKPLKSRQIVQWKVCLWDEKDSEGEWSDTAVFEMGLLEASEWKAEWIAGNYPVRKKRRYPADCFRKKFLIQKPVKKARLYSTACGLYEASFNNEKAGNFCLAPGITDYRKRVQYQTIDVTTLLQKGENDWSVMLADGWYRGSVGAWGLTEQYGTETKFLGQLEVEYEDGSSEIIVTDSTWDWSNDGSVRFADNKDGEIIEASRKPSYTQKAKKTSHDVVPSASNNVPLCENESFRAVLTTTPSGKYILDFGQNFAGYLSFQINAEEGDKIVLRFGEMLDENGELTQKIYNVPQKRKLRHSKK